MISWVVGNSKSKNSPVFKAFIIESVTGINDQISWNAFLVLVGDFQHEIGDWGALPVSAGGDLWVCSRWLPDLYAYENHHYWCPEFFTMTYDHGILLVKQGFANGKGGWAGGSEVTWKRLGTNIRAGGVFVDFASKPADSFSFSSLFNRATIINTSWAWV